MRIGPYTLVEERTRPQSFFPKVKLLIYADDVPEKPRARIDIELPTNRPMVLAYSPRTTLDNDPFLAEILGHALLRASAIIREAQGG